MARTSASSELCSPAAHVLVSVEEEELSVSAVLPPREVGASPTPPAARQVVTFLAVLAAAGLAALSGLGVGNGSKLAVVLPLMVAAGAMLGVLALTRFSAFVMALLVLRASIDLGKLGGGQAGQVTAATAAVAGRGLDPTSLLGVVFLLASALWLAAQHHRRGSLPGSTLRRALLVFVVAAAISVPASVSVPISLLELLRIVAAVTMFIVLEQLIVNRTVLRQVLLAAFLSLIFPLAYTALGFLTGGPASEVKGALTRITGPFNSSNTFGRYLMVMIVFGVALFPYLERGWQVGLAALLTPSAVFLVLTYTRTAIIGTVIGLAVVGLIQSRRLLAVLLVLSIVALLLIPQFSSRFTSLADVGSGGQPSGNTLAWRIGYWTEVLPLANSNPVTGIGLGSTQLSTDEAKQPHNDFIRAYVETGLLGLGAYLAMLIALVGLGRRAVRASPPGSFDRGVAAGFLGCAVAFVAVSIAANVLSSVVLLWYLFAFAAAAAFVGRQQPIPSSDRLVETGGSSHGDR
jgi:putative inorganic carbon (HCO3(-)) transporter